MNDHAGYGLVFLALAYLPLIAVPWRKGAAAWKFLTFCLCPFAILGLFLFLIPGVIAWLCAWASSAAARSAMNQEAVLGELREQNKLLRRQAGGSLP